MSRQNGQGGMFSRRFQDVGSLASCVENRAVALLVGTTSVWLTITLLTWAVVMTSMSSFVRSHVGTPCASGYPVPCAVFFLAWGGSLSELNC